MRFLSCTSSEEMELTGAMKFLVKNVLLELNMIAYVRKEVRGGIGKVLMR